MSRELTPARQAAHVATLKTLIFDTLEHTKSDPRSGHTEEDIGVAVSSAIETLALATQELWSDRFAIIGLVSVLGYRIRQGSGRQYMGTAMNALAELVGADLITTPLKAKLDSLQAFADFIAILQTDEESSPFLASIIERAREVSDERPGGFTSPTPLNDVFRRGRPDSDEYVFSADDAKDWSDEA